MTPLSAVPPPSEEPTPIPAHGLSFADDDIAADDEWSAAHQPATDPEALLLSALMWSNHPAGPTAETQRIIAAVTAADFDTAAYARLYEVIAALAVAGEQHDPASVTHALARAGSSGHAGDSLRHRLTGVATAGGHVAAAAHYADMVLSQAYRRSYRTVGDAIAQAAEELPEADLSGSRAVLSHEYPAQSVKGISVTGSSLRGFGSVHDTGQSYGRYVPSHLIFRSALRPDVRHFRGHPAGAPVVVSPAVSWPGLLAFVATMMCRVSVRASR